MWLAHRHLRPLVLAMARMQLEYCSSSVAMGATQPIPLPLVVVERACSLLVVMVVLRPGGVVLVETWSLEVVLVVWERPMVGAVRYFSAAETQVPTTLSAALSISRAESMVILILVLVESSFNAQAATSASARPRRSKHYMSTGGKCSPRVQAAALSFAIEIALRRQTIGSGTRTPASRIFGDQVRVT